MNVRDSGSVLVGWQRPGITSWAAKTLVAGMGLLDAQKDRKPGRRLQREAEVQVPIRALYGRAGQSKAKAEDEMANLSGSN